MSEHKIEREAVLWAWRALRSRCQHPADPSEFVLDQLVKETLAGDDKDPVVQVAIAYVESAKNHIDTVLELETNLARATEELESLRTVARWYRIADHNQRRFASADTAAAYYKADEAMDKALGGGSGGT